MLLAARFRKGKRVRQADAFRFLASLRRAISAVGLYPLDHPTAREAVEQAARSAAMVTEEDGRVVLSVVEGAFYLDKVLLPQASLELGPLVEAFDERGLSSISLKHPVSASDLEELAVFISSDSSDVPADGTIKINERPFSKAELKDAVRLSNLRRSYASALDLLRGVTAAADGGEAFELTDVASAVEGLLEAVLNQPGASLLLAGLKTHDEYTFFHSVNTSILAISLGKKLGLDDAQLVGLGTGALLHDVGKVRLLPSIIQYPGRLDDSQWAEVRLHPQEGAQAILAASGPGQEIAARVALEHHARFDDLGYPRVKGRGRLHLFSRMVTVCDVYDAMTTRRSYKRAEPPNRALQVLVEGVGTQFDPDLVRAFCHMMGLYPTGSLLQLSDESVVMVLEPGTEYPLVISISWSGEGEAEISDPRRIDPASVVSQLLPEQVGVRPATLLEDPHIVELLARA